MKSQPRVIAIHDSVGTIHSLMAWPSDSPPASPELQPGQYVHEIDVRELTLDMDDSQLHGRLGEVAENFRVELPTGSGELSKARLVTK
jgi:hypothetical protein